MLQECRRPRPEVDDHIEDLAAGTPHELGLAQRGPRMKASDRASAGARLILLNEPSVIDAGLGVSVGGEHTEEPSALVGDGLWFDQLHAVERGLVDLHGPSSRPVPTLADDTALEGKMGLD